MYSVGIDVGGTFTDVVAVDDHGRVTLAKAASTPSDPSVGVLDGLARLAEALGQDREVLLAQTRRIVHGTTVATNALLEAKGARVGLLTTEGHRDILEMREGYKHDRYNLRMAAPEPLVPRSRRLGVHERVRADGSIAIPLDEQQLDSAIRQLANDGVEAVAVCYLHSYANPAHEQVTGAAVRRSLPDAYVTLSSEVLPQIKEYERLCTTVVNAYVGPALANYLSRLEARLAEAGYRGAVLIMQSHGGVVPISEARRLAAGAVLSGPAGGVAGCRYSGQQLGEDDLMSFDMGGTSTDISMIIGGNPELASDRGIAGHSVALPSLDIATLGAGGGSIAHVDGGGILHVGPESAGAEPGPACYGRGGTAPTVTDANLALGYIDPINFLGGRSRLDVDAANTAIDGLAASLDTDRVAAADGILQVVNTQMAEGMRLVSVRRGIDPRGLVVVAFGGAAGLHVTELARRLDIERVVVPRVAAVLSAWGMLATDLRHEVVQTHIGDAGRVAAADLREVFSRMEDEGRSRLAEAFDGAVHIQRSLEMRYGEQVYEIGVSLDGLDLDAKGLMRQVVERFHQRHEDLYTYCLRDEEVVVVNARTAVVGQTPALPQEPRRPEGAPTPPRTRRSVFLGQWREVEVFDFGELVSAQQIDGPAVVESDTTTVLLRSGDRAQVTPFGWLDIGVARR